jgi:hypothetical protein
MATKITNPFDETTTSGVTTPKAATPQNPVVVPPPVPPPTPSPTTLESYTQTLHDTLHTQFPDSTPNDRYAVMSSFMFPARPPASRGKTFDQLVADAQAHRQKLQMAQLQQDQPIDTSKFYGSSSKISQGAEGEPATKRPYVDPVQQLAEQLFGKDTPTLDIYAPFTNQKVTVPNDPGKKLVKGILDAPEEAYNVVRDLIGIASGLIQGKGAQLPSDAMVPYDPLTGTGRRVPGVAEAYASMYQAGITSGLSPTMAKWAGGLSVVSALAGTGATLLAPVEVMTRESIAWHEKNVAAIDATVKLGYPEPKVLPDGTVETPLEAARRSYRELANQFHPDKPGGDPIKFKEVTDAWHTIQENGGPVHPSKMRMTLADLSYRMRGPLQDVFNPVSEPMPSTPKFAGRLAGFLPGYRAIGPEPQIPIGLAIRPEEPVGFVPEGVPKGFEIADDGAIVPSEEYTAWEKALKKEHAIAMANEESHPIESYSPRAKEIFDNINTHDPSVWEEFSRELGYSEAKIAQYKKYQNLFEEGKTKFGMTDQEIGAALGYGKAVSISPKQAGAMTKTTPSVPEAFLPPGQVAPVAPDVKLLGDKAFFDDKTISGQEKISRLLAIAKNMANPIDFGIGRDPDGIQVDISSDVLNNPSLLKQMLAKFGFKSLLSTPIKRAGVRMRNLAPATVDFERVLPVYVEKVASEASGVTDPFTKSAAVATMFLQEHPEDLASIELMVNANDPAFNYVVGSSGGKTMNEILRKAIDTVKNDPGGEAFRTTGPAPAAPSSPVDTIPPSVANEIYSQLKDTATLTGADMFSEDDVKGFTKEAADLSDIARATQQSVFGGEEMFGGTGETRNVAMAYKRAPGPAISLTPEQEQQLQKMIDAKIFVANEIDGSVQEQIDDMRAQLAGRPKILQKRKAEGKGFGTSITGREGSKQLEKVSTGEISALPQEPKTPETLAREMVVTRFIEAVAHKMDLTPEQITEIQKVYGKSDESALARDFGERVRSYGKENVMERITPFVDALVAGDWSTLSKLSIGPDPIPMEKVTELLNTFDAYPARDRAALAKAVVKTFNAKMQGNNVTRSANEYLTSIGYPGDVDTLLATIQKGTSEAVATKKLPHVNSENANARPSNIYQYVSMLRQYFVAKDIEGHALGILKSDRSPQFYFNKTTYHPETDIFDSGVEQDALKTDEELKQESEKPKPTVPAPNAIRLGGGTSLAKSFRFAKQRTYMNFLDGVLDGAQQRTLNPELLMRAYGNGYGPVKARNAIINTITAGNIGGWFVGEPEAKDWINVGKENPAFRQNIPQKDVMGKPQPDLVRNIWMHPKFYDAISSLLETAKPKKTGFIAAAKRNLRVTQAQIKAAQLSFSLFHPKQMGAAAAGAAGIKTFHNWLNMNLTSPEMMEAKLKWIGRGEKLADTGKTFSDVVQKPMGEDTTGETFLKTKPEGLKKIPGVAKVTDSSLGQWITSLADKNTELIFEKLQTFLKITQSEAQEATWINKHPNATPAQVEAAGFEIAGLVNGFFGGLNWAALGVGKGTLELLKSAIYAPDWFISNFIPTVRTIFGRPQYLTEISEPEFTRKQGMENAPPPDSTSEDAQSRYTRDEPGWKWDPAALRYNAMTFLYGIILTQTANYFLNGKINRDDYFNVVMGVDGKGREIKSNIFFPGSSRDMINAWHYYNESGMMGALLKVAGSKTAPFVSGAINTINMLASNGVDQVGNYVFNPEDKPAQRSWKTGLFYGEQSLPIPISLSNPFSQYDKYVNNGGSTMSENILALSGFGYIAHNHMGQKIENDFWKTKDGLTKKFIGKRNISVQEIAIYDAMVQQDAKLKEYDKQRARLGEDTTIPYRDKLQQEIALDNKIQDLMTSILNPSDKVLERAMRKYNIGQTKAARQAALHPGANEAVGALP